MDLIELHNIRFVSQDSLPEFLRIIQNSLRSVDYFGTKVHGKSSVNLSVGRGEQDKIVMFAKQINRLIANGILKTIQLDYLNHHITLTKPLVSNIGGIGSFYETGDPIVLKFLCEEYEARSTRDHKITIKDIKKDKAEWVTVSCDDIDDESANYSSSYD